MKGWGRIDVFKYKSPEGKIGYLVETCGWRTWRLMRPIIAALGRIMNITLVPDGCAGDMIGIWPICPSCGARWFTCESLFNQGPATCPNCGKVCQVRGCEWPYTMVGYRDEH